MQSYNDLAAGTSWELDFGLWNLDFGKNGRLKWWPDASGLLPAVERPAGPHRRGWKSPGYGGRAGSPHGGAHVRQGRRAAPSPQGIWKVLRAQAIIV